MLEIQIELVEGRERLCAFRFLDGETSHGGRQGERIEPDLADRDFSVEGRRELGCEN